MHAFYNTFEMYSLNLYLAIHFNTFLLLVLEFFNTLFALGPFSRQLSHILFTLLTGRLMITDTLSLGDERRVFITLFRMDAGIPEFKRILYHAEIMMSLV